MPHRSRPFAGRLVVVALCLLVATGCDKLKDLRGIHLTEKPGDSAKQRVDFIFKTIQAEGVRSGLNVQTAICRWAENEVYIKGASEQEAAVDAFGAWVKEGRLERGVKSYEIVPEVRYAVAGDPPETYYVQIKIDGSARWLRVPPKARISWAG